MTANESLGGVKRSTTGEAKITVARNNSTSKEGSEIAHKRIYADLGNWITTISLT